MATHYCMCCNLHNHLLTEGDFSYFLFLENNYKFKNVLNLIFSTWVIFTLTLIPRCGSTRLKSMVVFQFDTYYQTILKNSVYSITYFWQTL